MLVYCQTCNKIEALPCCYYILLEEERRPISELRGELTEVNLFEPRSYSFQICFTKLLGKVFLLYRAFSGSTITQAYPPSDSVTESDITNILLTNISDKISRISLSQIYKSPLCLFKMVLRVKKIQCLHLTCY
jgi:hypothetical protein